MSLDVVTVSLSVDNLSSFDLCDADTQITKPFFFLVVSLYQTDAKTPVGANVPLDAVATALGK
jgi:hypothetical protein